MAHDFTVQVTNTFNAESPEDAVLQMAAWLVDTAHKAGYRAWQEDATDGPLAPHNEGVFIDAEGIDSDGHIHEGGGDFCNTCGARL